MKRLWRHNGLSIVLVTMFLALWLGQSYVGCLHSNEELAEHGKPPESYSEYLTGSHFLEATMENWESEFFQMGVYVLFTVFLFQKGSSESKDPDGLSEVDADPRGAPIRPDTPLPVRKGGWRLRLYEQSLSLAFLLLFLVSFFLHAASGAREYNKDQEEHGSNQRVTTSQYLRTSQFWFESLQNWQSEFLAVAAIVILSIFLRQKGSPESKPVASPHSETGSG